MVKRRAVEQDGGTLLIVLILITVFGLVLGGLLTESSASVQFTSVVKTRQGKVYAADAGVSLAIQQVRQNNELCPEPAFTSDVPIASTINGVNVDVKCTGTTGSVSGSRGYAIHVAASSTGTAGTLHTSGGSGDEKIVQGPVFVDGTVDLQASMTLKQGRFYHKSASCNETSLPTNLTIADSGYSYICAPSALALPPNTAPPGGVPAMAPSPTGSSCKTFYPGTYTDLNKPVLATENYFVSGVYYFNFTGSLSLDGKWVYGGEKGAAENRILDNSYHTLPSCVTNGDPGGYSDAGTGVKFIFGSTAGLDLSKGHMELFARKDDPAVSPAPSGTNGISVVAAPSSWTGWTPSTAGTTVIDMSQNLNLSDMAVHGLVWARDQRLNLGAVNSTRAQVLGGVLANYVDLQAAANVDGLAVSVVDGNPDPRYVKLVATVSESGSKDVTSTAIIKLDNDIAVGPTIESWRTGGITDP